MAFDRYSASDRMRGHDAGLAGHTINSSLELLSGADDTSPCCEQINLLRIVPSVLPLAYKKLGGRTRGRFHWYPQTTRTAGRIKGFLGICSIKCFRCNTAPVACDIATYPDMTSITARFF